MLKRYAFFDFDGTLIDGDSIVRFLQYARKRKMCSLWHLVSSSVMAAGYYLHLTTAEKAKQSSVSFLKGKSEKEIAKLSNDFCRDVLLPSIRKQGFDELSRRRRSGCRVVLVSASPDFYLQPLRRMLPIDDILATRFDIQNGVFTGLIAGHNCRGVEKPLRLAEYLSARGEMVDYQNSYAYGDSAGDEPMLRLCAFKTCVNPKKKLLKRIDGADGVKVVRW